MAGPRIKTPRNQIIMSKNGKITLTWGTNYKPKWQKRFTLAQIHMDFEALRLCYDYIPLKTGRLISSGYEQTKYGSGKIIWVAPYAGRQYWFARPVGTHESGPLRGPQWFARMKADHGKRLIKEAKKLAGRG